MATAPARAQVETNSLLVMGGAVMRHVLVPSLAGVAFLIVTASPAAAAERLDWSGRDVNNKNIFWTCSNVGGNNWTLKKNGTVYAQYVGVTSTAEFVELQLKGIKTFDRLRLYSDKMSLNKEGSRTAWIPLAKGKWTK